MKRITSIIAITAAAILGLSSAASAGGTVYAHPKMHHWYASEGGKQSLTKIGNDQGAIGTDADNNDDAAVGADCQSLRNDVTIAQNIAPNPLAPSVQRLWSAALNAYGQGATQCVAGVNDDDANGEIEAAVSDFTTGTALITHLDKSL